MVISVCNGQEGENNMSEGDCREPSDPTQLTLILALFIYPECFLMKGYESIDLSTVDDVKSEASRLSNVSKDALVVTHNERVLRDEASLRSYGVKTGDTLMITRAFVGEQPAEPKKLTESEIQTIIKAYKGYKKDPKSKAVFEKLHDASFLKKLIDTVPGLEDDLSGYSLVANPRLFIQMGDADVIRRAIQHHPWVAVAAWNFMAIVEEERVNMPDVPETANNLLGFSDDEDRDTPRVPDHLPSPALEFGQRLRDEPVVTATQLAAALAAALGGPSTSRSSSSELSPVMPPLSTRTPMFHPPSTGHDFVTPEMFNDAVQRAYANMPSRSHENGPSSLSRRQPEGPPELSREQLSHQMGQMQELGLVDEAVNLRALRITGGDVQGAVDLIFGGLWLGDEGPEVELESMQESE
ncbi:ubiquitin-like protein 7 [Hetaerina americana]|uniref:ubiquitin-like protein 7 n=1 Tax=Hetaerina americana TaxID=62018 RepID=UPI003A7F4181